MKLKALLGMLFFSGAFSFWVAITPVSALDVPPIPKDIPIVDQTNTLSDEQKLVLAQKIAKERTETGNQIAILMIKSLEDESLEDYSLQVARQWGIGQKDRDSGVLMLIAKDDRVLRIEVGRGLEGPLPDITSGRIIRDRIAPEFRNNNYYAGINAGLDGIILAIHGEADPKLSSDSQALSSTPWEFVFFLLLFVPVWLGSVLARTKSWWAGGVIGGIVGVVIGFIFGFAYVGIVSILILTGLGLLFDRAVSRNYKSHLGRGDSPSWWAGGPYIGGGGSGGGFGGFGGGGFGGGGSSGSW